MVKIAQQLQNPEFRFVLLGKWDAWKNKETNEETEFQGELYEELKKEKKYVPLGKAPFEKNWQKQGYKYDDKRLIEHQGNIGIIGGYGNLVILDIDDKELGERLEAEYDTFTVKTGTGGKHFYFICEDKIKNTVLAQDKGELRAENYQVVCPHSKHPNGNFYEIYLDKQIKRVSSNFILSLIKDYLRKEEEIEEITIRPQDTSRSGFEYRRVVALLREGKSKEDIFNEMMKYSKWTTHGSKHPQYRENTYKNALHFIEQEKKIQEKQGEQQKDTKEISEVEYQKALDKLGEAYVLIKKVLRKYCDLDERYYNLVAIWIIGTYFHKEFISYPYLFFNAMKGSGKTRTLHLISNLMRRGKLQVNMSEAVLFRTAEHYGFCIDEVERISSKEYAPLRELLNTAYKRGMNIERCKKRKIDGEEQYVIDTYKVFTPICFANIRGMDDVLGDRSIIITLEKSGNDTITRTLETFEFDKDIASIKQILGSDSVIGAVSTAKGVYNILYKWNELLTKFYENGGITLTSTHNNNIALKPSVHTEDLIKEPILETALVEHSDSTLDSDSTKQHNSTMGNYDHKIIDFFEKVIHTNISGRNLELFLPLFIISNFFGYSVLEETLKTAKEIVGETKEEEAIENKDVNLIDFVASRQEENIYIPIRDLVADFKTFLQEADEETKWMNSQWFGKALKRLRLIRKKRRLARGREVMLDFTRAKRQIKIFKNIPKEDIVEPEKPEQNKITDKSQQTL